MKAAETLFIVCLPPEEHISWKKIFGNRPSKNSHFYKVSDILKTVQWIFFKIYH